MLSRAAGDRQAAVMAAQQAYGAGAMAGGFSSSSNFLAYSYSFCPNPQLLAQANNPQAFNPQQHVDPTKWVQALQANPDPQSCYPEALVGLPALEQRLQQQQKAVEETNGALEELRAGMSNLKDQLQAQSSQRLEECRQRQQRLQRQLLQVVVALERRALQAGAARRNPQVEAQLEARLARLEEACCAPGGARARLEEDYVQLRQLLQMPGGLQAGLATDGSQIQLPAGDTGATGTGAAAASSTGGAGTATTAEQAVLRVTGQQGELLELLAEDLAKRRRDTAQLEAALGMGRESQGQGQGTSSYGMSGMQAAQGAFVNRPVM